MVMRRTLAMLAIAGAFGAAGVILVAAAGGAGDMAALVPGEDRPGGDTTHFKALNRDVFSHHATNLPFAAQLDFQIGNGLFTRPWVSAPASTRAADGLGPLFNARACQDCHIKDGRGHPPVAAWPGDDAVSMILRLGVPTADGGMGDDPAYGAQLQDFAVQGHRAEGHMRVDYEEFTIPLSGGEVVRLRRPAYTITDLAYGPLDADVRLSPRVAPPVIGLGLLEQIPAADIMACADPDDRDRDGVSGRAQQVAGPDGVTLGRFGWKAGAPSLDAQNQGAFNGDIGISTPLRPRNAGDCTARQSDCLSAPHGGDDIHGGLEAPGTVTDLVLFYTRHLAVPARRNASHPDVLRGRQLFHDAGCAACHTPSHRTDRDGPEPALRGQLIWPYTDLLLHDMGPGLADGFAEGVATGSEWRTAPLWGVGLTGIVAGQPATFLHDGRARSLTEAILWHGGEASASQHAFRGLSAADRAALLRFVESL